MTNSLDTDAGLHLVVDGRRVIPNDDAGSNWSFLVPASARSVRIVSRAAIPALLGLGEDRRLLGFAIRNVTLAHAGQMVSIPAHAPELFDGYYAYETDGWRWTTGDAEIPMASFLKRLDTAAGDVHLNVDGFALPSYGTLDNGRAADRELFLKFESIGEDCEFAFAQSHYGAEPISLLRWCSTDIHKLGMAFRKRFDGLGNPAHAKLEWSEAAGEYKLCDERYFVTHTGITTRCADAAEEDAIAERGFARLQLLRRKMIADIERGDKIFVMKSFRTEAGLPAFRRLHAALSAIAPSRLLCVSVAQRGVAAGTVERMDDGLLVGVIDRFVANQGPYEVWRTLCGRAHELARAP